MRSRSPFQSQDLDDLDEKLLDRALAVAPMKDIAAGTHHREIIGLRHDVDNFIQPAVDFARWEHDRGYRSTYYILHTAPYWDEKTVMRASLEEIADLGHEIGIHNNALAAALLTGRDPAEILAEAIDELRGYGFHVRGTVAHGDRLCYASDGTVRFVNDEMFVECPRPSIGESFRRVGALDIRPLSMSLFGLEYDANWVGSRVYLSDSGGRWSAPGFGEIARGFPYPDLQLHVLVHADWWREAFVTQEIAV